MIRTLLFATIWSHVFSMGAVLVLGLAGSLLPAKPAPAEPTPQATQAAGIVLGIPGVAGFLGAGLGLLGLLPGTTLRNKVFRPSSRPLMRQLNPALFALQQLLDGYPFPPTSAVAGASRSDLPRISVLAVGIISMLLAIAGVLCSLVTLFDTRVPAGVDNVLAFRIVLYATLLVCLALCGWLLLCGFEFAQMITRKTRQFGYVMMLELLGLTLAGSFVRVLCWLVPQIGPSVGAGIEAARSGFMVQVVVLFPLWAPFLMLYAVYHLDAQKAARRSGAAARAAVDKAQLLKTLQDKYQAVRRMYEGLDYMSFLDASPAKQRAGVFAAMKFIRCQPDGESRYIAAMTELSQAFNQAMPAYEAAVLHAEVAFFQSVRAGMLRSMSLSEDMASPAVETRHSAAVEALESGTVEALESGAAEALESGAVEIREFLPAEDDRPAVPQMVSRPAAPPARDRKEPPEVEILEPATFLAPSDDSFDFGDVLDADEPEIQAISERTIQQISDELASAIRRHVTVDWTVRKGAKGEMRLIVKRILRRHGYPPHRHETVVQAVLRRAEAFCLELGGLAP